MGAARRFGPGLLSIATALVISALPAQAGSSMVAPYASAGLAVTAVPIAVSSGIVTSRVALSDSKSAPPAPSHLVVTSISAAVVSLQWNAASGAASYKLYRNGVFTGATAPAPGTSAQDTPIPTPVPKGTTRTFIYTVTAVGSGKTAGESDGSNTASATLIAPGDPSNLVLTSTASGRIALSWTAPGNHTSNTSYIIWRDSPASGWVLLRGQANAVQGTGFTDTGLTDGTLYTYQVYAIDNATVVPTAANDPLWNAVGLAQAGIVCGPPPAQPTGLSVTGISAGVVSLHWNAVAGATSYKVYRGATQATTVTTNSATDTPLALPVTAGTTQWFTYTVVAGNAAGGSRASSPTTATLVAPGNPTNLALTPNALFQVQLIWRAPANATPGTTYIVWRGNYTAPSGYTNLVEFGPTSATSYLDRTSTNVQSYWYQVFAIDNATIVPVTAPTILNGWGAIGYVQGPVIAKVAPAQPTGLIVTGISAGVVSLQWNTVSGATSYKIYRGTTLATTVTTNSGTDTPLALPVTAGTTQSFTYTVAASNAAGNSKASAPVTTTLVAPGSPTNLALTPSASGQVQLTWTTPANATAQTTYIVWRGNYTAPSTYTNLVQFAAVSATSYLDTTTTSGQSYWYQVFAIDNATVLPASAPTILSGWGAIGYVQGSINISVEVASLKMQLLVVSQDGTEPSLPLIEQNLNALGTPYTVYIESLTPGGLTPAYLSNGALGNFQGVILTTNQIQLSTAEVSALQSYESSFGVREVIWYASFPTPDLGYQPFVWAGDTSGNPIALQFVGSSSTIFNYVNQANGVSVNWVVAWQRMSRATGRTPHSCRILRATPTPTFTPRQMGARSSR